MLRNTWLALFAALTVPTVALAGCDLDALLSDAAEAAKEEVEAEVEKQVEEAAEPAPEASPGVDSCVAACDANADLSADDRATCRLNCEEAGAAPVAGTKHETIRAYRACKDACAEGKSKTDAATCGLNCASQATAKLGEDGGEGEDNATQQRACGTTCLEDMAACGTGCETPGEKRTDQATCRLECENLAGRCVDSCKDAK